MKKILVFASTFPRWKNDKIPTFVYDLSKRLTKNFEVSVLAPNYPGAKKTEVMDGMKINRFMYFFEKSETLAGSGGIMPALKKSKWNYFKVPFFMAGEFFALSKLIRENRPDVVHAHWIIPQGVIAAICKKLYGVSYVVTSHGSDIMGLKGFNWVKRFVLRNAKRITVVSNALKKEVLKIDSSLKVDVIPMGIDVDLFNPNKKDAKVKKNLGVKGSLLTYVGRLAPEKGIDRLIEAMPKVVKKFPNTKLLLIGDGTLKEELKDLVRELDLKDNVVFKGWVHNKDLPKYYASSDVFVCLSVREGLGLTFAEAGASGCALIGTKVGGITDIIQDDKNGLLIGNEDSAGVSKKIIEAVSNKSKTNKMKKESRKMISEKFGWDKVVERFGRVLG